MISSHFRDSLNRQTATLEEAAVDTYRYFFQIYHAYGPAAMSNFIYISAKGEGANTV